MTLLIQITLPEVALLRFNVYDGDKNIGNNVIPVSCLRPGYHHIGLKVLSTCTTLSAHTLQHSKNPLSTIFVNIKIQIYVPDEHSDFIDRLQNPTVNRTGQPTTLNTS